MNKIIGKAIAGFTLVLAIICGFDTETAKAQPGASVSIQTFYDELEPYGGSMIRSTVTYGRRMLARTFGLTPLTAIG
jgi:hypothetical protein